MSLQQILCTKREISMPELENIVLSITRNPQLLSFDCTVRNSFNGLLEKRYSVPEFISRLLHVYNCYPELTFLKPVHTSRLLSKEQVRSNLKSPSFQLQSQALQSGIDSIDIPNTLLHTAELLQSQYVSHDSADYIGRGKQLQDKLLRPISDFFGINRLSIPELEFCVDILSYSRLNICSVPETLKSTVLGKVIQRIKEYCEKDSLDAIFSYSSMSFILDETKINYLLNEHENGTLSSMYFNHNNLLESHEFNSSSMLYGKFKPWYDTMNSELLTDFSRKNFSSSLDLLHILAIESSFVGISKIDALNGLVMYQTPQNDSHWLPSVAQFLFGKKRFESSRFDRTQVKSKRNGSNSRPDDCSLPVLELVLKNSNVPAIVNPYTWKNTGELVIYPACYLVTNAPKNMVPYSISEFNIGVDLPEQQLKNQLSTQGIVSRIIS